MSAIIGHAELDAYEACNGDPGRLPHGQAFDTGVWELLEALLLDLHLLRHRYADEAYARHVERRLVELCTDSTVVERMKAVRT